MGFRPNCFNCIAHLYLCYTLLVLHFTCTAHLCLLYKALMYFLSLWNTIQFFSISNMVSKPLLWPFLSSLVFISVTPFSTSLSPSQQPSQPFTVEPSTSSSHRPWVLDLQLLSLRNFTLHRPLPFASPLQILLRPRFWRYHRDRLAPIYTIVKASAPSETAHAPTRRSKALFLWSRAPRAFHAPLHIWVLSHAPPYAIASGHTPFTRRHAPPRISSLLLTSSTSTLACAVANITCLRVSR